MALVSLVLLASVQAAQLSLRHQQLENGLRAIIVEDHTLPLVSVQLWYRVGSAQDPPSRPGVCHSVRAVLEQRDDAAFKLRAAGLRFESHTERDACHFSTVLPPNFLEYVLDIEAARMKPLTVSAETVRQGVNAAARHFSRETEDDPDHIVMRQLLATMFPDHPYQHPPGLVAESLTDLSVEDVNEFLERWFVPGNATLFVIGDVSTPLVLEQVRRRFGELEWAEPPRRAEPRRLDAERIRTHFAEEGSARALIAWQTPPLGYFENAAIDVLMHGLLNEFDGPLYQALRETSPIPVKASWRRYAWRDAGLLVLELSPIYTWPRSGSIDPLPAKLAFAQSMASIEQTLVVAETRVPDEIAHNRARALAERDAWNCMLAFGDRSRGQARHELVGGDLLLTDFIVPRIRHVGVADVQMAAHILSRARRVVIETGSDMPIDAPVTSASALTRPLVPVAPPRFDATEALAQLSELARGAPKSAAPSKHPRVERGSLEDGIPVTVCKIPEVRRAAVALVHGRSSVSLPMSIEAAPRSARGKRSPSLVQMLDYSAYHGVMRLRGVTQQPVSTHASDRGPSADIAVCEPARAPAMLEWFGRLIADTESRPPPRSEPALKLEVVAVGDVSVNDLGDLGDAMALSISREQKELSGMAAASDDHGEAPQPPDGPRELRFEIVAEPNGRATANSPGYAELEFRWSWLRQTRPPNEMELRVLSQLLGWLGSDGEPLGRDLRRGSRDHLGKGPLLFARVALTAGAVEPTLRALHARITALRDEAVPPGEFTSALRRVQNEQLVRLDGPIGILEALLSGQRDPWRLDDRLTPETFGRRLAEIASGELEIRVSGADEPTLERLRREFSIRGSDRTPEP